MFEKYEVDNDFLYPEGYEKVNIIITDTDFVETVVAYKTPSGLDIMTPLIALYEVKGKNVPANIAKAYIYLCDRFKLDPKGFLGRMIAVNKCVDKYKDDIYKYLILL